MGKIKISNLKYLENFMRICSCSVFTLSRLFPWGNNETPRGEHWMNIWHGDFPDTNTMEDGYITTSPVSIYKSFTC